MCVTQNNRRYLWYQSVSYTHLPIIVRISAEERVPGGNTLEDTLEYLGYLDEFVDMYDVSCGLNPSLQYQIDSNFLPDGWRSYMARAVKEKFGKPVINAGNYRDPEVCLLYTSKYIS